MIERLIETSRIQECSRIIEIESKSDSDIEEIQFSNKKEKQVELEDNQKTVN